MTECQFRSLPVFAVAGSNRLKRERKKKYITENRRSRVSEYNENRTAVREKQVKVLTLFMFYFFFL